MIWSLVKMYTSHYFIVSFLKVKFTLHLFHPLVLHIRLKCGRNNKIRNINISSLPRHWGETDLPHSIMYHVLFYSSSWLIPLGPTFQLHVLLFLTFLQESEVQLHSNIPVYSLHGCILYCTYVPDVIFLELLHWEVRTAFIPSW